jgi:hypothetical protein
VWFERFVGPPAQLALQLGLRWLSPFFVGSRPYFARARFSQTACLLLGFRLHASSALTSLCVPVTAGLADLMGGEATGVDAVVGGEFSGPDDTFEIPAVRRCSQSAFLHHSRHARAVRPRLRVRWWRT